MASQLHNTTAGGEFASGSGISNPAGDTAHDFRVLQNERDQYKWKVESLGKILAKTLAQRDQETREAMERLNMVESSLKDVQEGIQRAWAADNLMRDALVQVLQPVTVLAELEASGPSDWSEFSPPPAGFAPYSQASKAWPGAKGTTTMPVDDEIKAAGKGTGKPSNSRRRFFGLNLANLTRH
jgi:hypothetical protein